MKARILSTIGLWLAIITLLVLFKDIGAILLLALITAATQFEFYALLERIGMRPLKREGVALGIISLLGSYTLMLYTPENASSHLTIFALCICAVLLTSLKKPSAEWLKSTVMPTLIGLLVIPFMMHFYVMLIAWFSARGEPIQGILTGVWLIAVIKFTDVGALLVGKKIGHTKLARSISPGKTWEGVAGGVVVSMIVGALLALILEGAYSGGFPINPIAAALIALPISATGVVSDLLESVLKRQAGQKDSGQVIPGIGGAFDLSDSLILSAPVGYLLITLTADTPAIINLSL